MVRWTRRNQALAAALAAVALLLVFISAVSVALAVYYRRQEAVQRGLVAEKTALATSNQQLADGAQTALRKAETALVDMQASHGQLAAERGDAAGALSWFAAAAQQAESDPGRQADNRLRARNWARTAVLPVAAFSLGSYPRTLAFRPGGDQLLMLAGSGRLFVWDWRRDRLEYRSDEQLPVSAACWSPDGDSFVLGSPSGVVQVHEARDGALVQALKHPGAVTALAFSPDGRYLAVAGDVVRLWDAQAQRFLDAAWKHPQAVGALAFNHKGDRLVTACADGRARLYAVPGLPGRPAPLFDPVPHSPAYGWATRPAFVDGDRGLVTVSGDRQLTWWNAESMKPVPAGDITTKSYGLSKVVASPRGDWFATGGFSGVEVWSCAAGASRSLVLEHLNFVEDLVFGADGTTLLTASWDETARLWSLPEGRALSHPLPHMGMVTRGDLSGDNRYLATAQLDGLVRVWQRPAADVVRSHMAAGGRRLRVSFDGRLAAPGIWHEEPRPYTVPDVQQVQVVDVAAVQPAGPAVSLPGILVDCCVCADNRSAAAVSREGNNGWLSVWDVATGRPLFEPRKLPGPGVSVAARPQGSHLAVLCKTGDLLVFELPTGARVFDVRHDGWNRTDGRWPRVEYTPDGATLVTLGDGSHDNTVCVRDADTGRLRFAPLCPVLRNGICRSLAVSADSRLLATAVNGKNAAQVWDLADGRALCAPIPHAGDDYGLFHVSFSPDGRRILTSSKNGLALLWDWQAGGLACPPLKHRDEVFAGWITPDGGHAVTACRGTSGTLHVWELTTGKPVAPPLRLAPNADPNLVPAHVALSADGKEAYASVPGLGFRGQVRLADLLDPPELSTQDLVLLAELASAQRIESAAESRLTTEQWLQRWEHFRRKQSVSPRGAVVDSQGR
jgi:WD40 repeat protein